MLHSSMGPRISCDTHHLLHSKLIAYRTRLTGWFKLNSIPIQASDVPAVFLDISCFFAHMFYGPQCVRAFFRQVFGGFYFVGYLALGDTNF